MKVLVTGATGFTGSCAVQSLLRNGIAVRCFVRPTSNLDTLPVRQIELARGNLDDRSSLESSLRGVDALVNIASLGFGHAEHIVSAAANASIRRSIFISSTSVFTQLDSRSKPVRLKAEEAIQNSQLAYTILRPTMIYGSSRDRNMCRLIRYIQRWPLIPVFGNQNSLHQPVHVADVADAVGRALVQDATIGKAYNIPGGNALSLDQIIDVITRLLNRNIRKIHLASAPFAAALSVMERFYPYLPLKAEQVLRLDEDKSFDYSDASRDFHYRPRPFDEGIALEIAQLKPQ